VFYEEILHRVNWIDLAQYMSFVGLLWTRKWIWVSHEMGNLLKITQWLLLYIIHTCICSFKLLNQVIIYLTCGSELKPLFC
jgi:hypothetical protein